MDFSELKEKAEEIRRLWGENDAKRDAGQETPDDIVRYDDIPYGKTALSVSHGAQVVNGKQWNLLDVYKPKGEDDVKYPVIVSVHGGAWVYGTKEVYQYYCMKLAGRGFAVVNFNYRLAPENKFPSSLEDTCAVFRWIEENADKYGLDKENVFAVGDSAGAHLLSLYAAFASNEKFAAKFSFKAPENIKLKAIALNCGKYKMDEGLEEEEDAEWLLEALLKDGGSKDEFKMINSPALVTEKYPKVFLMTCTGDFLKDQAKFMVSALEKNSVEFNYHFYGSKDSVLGHVFHCDPRLPEAVECNDEEVAFFRKFIG